MNLYFYLGTIASFFLALTAAAAGAGQLPPGIAGTYHSTNGFVAYVVNGATVPLAGSTCQLTQPFSFSAFGSESGSISYAFNCSTGFQAQAQGDDFNPSRGPYQNGYNSISSFYIVNNSGIVEAVERDQTTTWGFGSMVNYQHQKLVIVGPVTNANGQKTLSFELRNDQTNVQNDQITVYHMDLIQD